MKPIFSLAIAPPVLPLPSLSQGQYKYIKRNNGASKENEIYHFVSKVTDGGGDRGQGAAPGTTGSRTGTAAETPCRISPTKPAPSLISGPIDVYTEDPALGRYPIKVIFG